MTTPTSWKGLTIEPGHQPEFSPYHLVKMWDLAIRTDDLDLIKTLIQKNLFPEEGRFRPLTHLAFLNQSPKVLSWLLTSQDFQEEVRIPEFLKIITNHYDENNNEHWFKMVKLLTPYLLGANPVLDENGDTLVFHLLKVDEFLFQDADIKEWLLSEEVHQALEVPNKKGLAFFDNARAYLSKRSSMMFSEYHKNLMDELETLGVQERLKSLPKSTHHPDLKRI